MKTETALHIRLSANPTYRDFMKIVRGSLGLHEKACPATREGRGDSTRVSGLSISPSLIFVDVA